MLISLAPAAAELKYTYIVWQKIPSEDNSDVIMVDLAEGKEQVTDGAINVDKHFGVPIEQQELKLVQKP